MLAASQLLSMTKKENNYQDLIETIEKMTVLELSEFVKVIEEKFGVSAAMMAPAPSAAVSGGASEVAAVEEKSIFNVVLKDTGSSKIQVIKAVKEITGKGLQEAKEITDKTPAVIKEGVKKEEAQELKKKLEDAGATAALE